MVAIRRPATLALQWLMSYVRRLGWGVADQAVSSLTNFALVLYVAHRVGAAQFGAFSLAYVTYSFALNASRGLASDPLMVRFSGVDLQTWRRAVGSCTGAASVIGAATGACVLVATTVLGGATKFAFLALGLTLPALLLQDSWRFSFFALGRGRQAFLNDLVWAVALIPALFFLRATKAQNVFWFVFAWGAGAAVAAGVGLLQARVAPRLSDATKWLSQHRDLGYRYLAENTTNSGASQLFMYGLSLILGLSAVGYIQAANTLVGPAMVLHGDDHGRDSRSRQDSASLARTPAAILPRGEQWAGRGCGCMGSCAFGRATEGSRDLDGRRHLAANVSADDAICALGRRIRPPGRAAI